MSMRAEVKGEISEGLLAKSAQESRKGAGPYFTPRELIKAAVEVMQPGPDDARKHGGIAARSAFPSGASAETKKQAHKGPI